MPWRWKGKLLYWHEGRTPWHICMVLEPGLPYQPSALAVLVPEKTKVLPPTYALRHLRRFPPGTPYPVMSERLIALLQTPELKKQTLVLVDRTGVGQAIYRLFLDTLRGQVECRFAPVNVTAGQAPTSGLSVPRREVAGTLDALLQTRRLRTPEKMPLVDLLTQELAHFSRNPPLPMLDDVSAWRQGPQDDLVLAVGIAAWICVEVYRVSQRWR